MDEIFFIVRSDLKGAPVRRQREVAQSCDIAWSTLRRIVDGATNVNYSTIQKLRAHYLTHDSETAPRPQQAASGGRRRQMG